MEVDDDSSDEWSMDSETSGLGHELVHHEHVFQGPPPLGALPYSPPATPPLEMEQQDNEMADADDGNDSGTDLHSLLTTPAELGYEPPDRSQQNLMMPAILYGVIPPNTIEPSSGFVPNPHYESRMSTYDISLTREVDGRFTNLMLYMLTDVLPKLEEHKDFDLYADPVPRRMPAGFDKPFNRRLGLTAIKQRILSMYYTKADECFDDATETLYYFPQDFYDYENPKCIHVLYTRALFQRMAACAHEGDVPVPPELFLNNREPSPQPGPSNVASASHSNLAHTKLAHQFEKLDTSKD